MNVEFGNIEKRWYFLTDVPDVNVVTPADRVKLVVTIMNSESFDTVIDQYYVTHEGMFVLAELSYLVESFLDATESVYCTVSVTASIIDENGEGVMNSASFNVMYCNVLQSKDVDDMEKFFLVSSDKKIMHKNSSVPEYVGMIVKVSDNLMESMVQPKSVNVTVIAYCHLDDDSNARVTFTDSVVASRALSVLILEFSYESILAKLKSVNPHVSDCRSFRIESEGRVLSYMVDDADTMLVEFFAFRNLFGVKEVVGIPGVTKDVRENTQSVAISGHSRIRYDAKTEQSFQFQSAALATFLEPSVDSLMMSKEVWRVKSGISQPVLISDSTWEKTNEIGTVNTVKFTWKHRFIWVHEGKWFENIGVRVFNDTYDVTYG